MSAARRLLSRIVLVVSLAMLVPTHAAAQQEIVSFLAGGAVGLAMHESGHVILDLAFAAPPGLKRVSFGPLPFFAITHHPVSPVRELAISSAGFWVQEGSNEFLLTRDRYLRQRQAPLLKGVFAFNVLASVAYAGAALARTGPGERDTRGIAVSARVDERWIGGAILAPAIFDTLRYYKPETAWLRWAARASKAGGVLLLFKAR